MQHRLLGLVAILLSCLLSACYNGSNNPVSTLFSELPPLQMSRVQAVQDALAASNDPGIAQVHVEEIQGRVILSGYVKKIRQSDTAQQIASQVQGVETVENHIIVRQ